jgi:two-component system sensor histidine kinase CpxA
MIKPTSSLLAKILCWFFLNLALVVVVLAVFFAFQPQVNLHAIFGKQISNRLRTAGMLIAHDLNQTSPTSWSEILARHAAIHQVDFALVLEDGSRFSSKDMKLPEEVIKRVRDALPRKPPPRQGPPPRAYSACEDKSAGDEAQFVSPHGETVTGTCEQEGDRLVLRPNHSRANSGGRRQGPPPPAPPRHGPPPPGFDDPQRRPANHARDDARDLPKKGPIERIPPMHADADDKGPHLMMRTRHPTRYWAGIRIPLPSEPLRPPPHAFVFAVSDSVTGNGFFFDPLPWMVVAATVILISMLFWIPMVKHITRPLSRMTHAAEEIAKGSFEISIHEPRADEIGRLAKTINHMTSRLSAFVKGQKRFLGDVAHELGSPIARIQFGLGALEQRVEGKSRKRVTEVMEDVDHLSKLVNELLAFSRADLKSNTVKLERIELLPVVQTAVKRESTLAAKIITKIDPGIRVIASSELLIRALANLVRNAVKYAGDAGPIYVSAEKRKDVVEIEVRDSGSGVPEDLLDQLFEPFFRPEASRDRDSGGVGLGLAIVKTCVETCKGTVSAANLKPNGFAVTITLNS